MAATNQLIACFDESCGKGFTILAGWIASAEEWEHFETDWTLFLIDYGVPVFHMREYSQSVGPFAKWKDTPHFRARFLHDAWEIIRTRVRTGFVCCVQDVLFNRVNRFYRLDEKFPSCYALAGTECVTWATAYAEENGKTIHCIFDDGGPDKRGLRKSVGLNLNSPTPTFEPSRDVEYKTTGTRRGIVHIQAADFLAYEIRKYAVDHALIRSGVRSPRKPLEMFGQKAPETKFFNEERLIALCQKYGIERRLPLIA
jgi:hypothetical protein